MSEGPERRQLYSPTRLVLCVHVFASSMLEGMERYLLKYLTTVVMLARMMCFIRE